MDRRRMMMSTASEPELEPLRFEMLQNCKIYWRAYAAGKERTISYRKNGGSWVEITSTTGDGTPISVSNGDIVEFKGNNTNYGGNESGNYGSYFSCSGYHKLSGNIMAMLGSNEIIDDYALSALFSNDSKLQSVKDLKLPATSLTTGCYNCLFQSCSILTDSPELPATTLANSCYRYMFHGCSQLKEAPELPAENVSDYAYYHMFSNCTSLKESPLILAKSINSYSCSHMFEGCTSLTKVYELVFTSVKAYCCEYMFKDCSSLKYGPSILRPTGVAQYSYSYMFQGCSLLIAAPELKAINLTSHCYRAMFYNCGKLRYIKADFLTTPGNSYTQNWVYGVPNVGLFVKDSSATWTTTGTSGVPSGWGSYDGMAFICPSSGTLTFKLLNSSYSARAISYSLDFGTTWNNLTATTSGATASITGPAIICLKKDDTLNLREHTLSYSTAHCVVGNTKSMSNNGNVPSQYQFTRFFEGDTKLESAGNLYIYNVYNYSCISMFSGCTSLLRAPMIDKTNTYTNCYRDMFSGCTSLFQAPIELPALYLQPNCYQNMFKDCTSLRVTPLIKATNYDYAYCCGGVFYGCTSLVKVRMVAPTALSYACCYQMFYNCSSLVDFPEIFLSTTALYSSCYSGMFNSCTSLTKAPELPAAILASYCYQNMFYNCNKLESVKCLATDISADGCTSNWLSYVKGTGTFTKAASMTSWTSGTSGIPTNWTVVDYVE